MKSHKEKIPKKEHEGVETPPPPQVMDPSVPPDSQQNIDKGKADGKRPSEKNKNIKKQKFSPKHEL